MIQALITYLRECTYFANQIVNYLWLDPPVFTKYKFRFVPHARLFLHGFKVSEQAFDMNFE